MVNHISHQLPFAIVTERIARREYSGRRLTTRSFRTARLRIVAAACAGSACAGPQSALMPAGRDAERIDHLFTVMTVGALLVWCAVVAIAVYAMRTRATHSERSANLFVVGGGVILPAVVLAGLLAYGLPVLPAVLALPNDDSLVIHVTGKQWWWRVRYVTPDGIFETANEIRLSVGRYYASTSTQ
jgi:cytochrome c oxidase subunit II